MQRRRAFLAAGAIVFVVATASACGGSKSEVASRPDVRVYFCTELDCAARASDARIAVLRQRIQRDERVSKVRFVSAEQALAELRKKSPELTRALPSNPLPDRLDVWLKHDGDAENFASGFTPAPPGVERVVDFRCRSAAILLGCRS